MPPAAGHGGRRLAALLAVAALCLAAAEEPEPPPKSLQEIPASQMPEPGLRDFLAGHMEPTGVVCVAYVKKGSKNHKLMRQLARATRASDAELGELDLPMAAVLNHEKEEGVVIMKRQYANNIWKMLQMTGLDTEPVAYPAAEGKTWKKEEVKKWMLENAWPTFNFRVRSMSDKVPAFPWPKYFGGGANKQGVGLIAVNLADKDYERLQIRMASTLRPHIEELNGKFHWTVFEKSEFTLNVREASKLGLDSGIEAEVILIENPQSIIPSEKIDNFWHGNPTKYRLLNFTKDAVSEFFTKYTNGELPTYWATRENTDYVSPDPDAGDASLHLTSGTFEEEILNADKDLGCFVSFYNMNTEEGCDTCLARRGIWNKVTKQLKRKHKWLSPIKFGSLDQSSNEHPESRVAGRLAEPVVMWYPPGSQKQRWRDRSFMQDIAMNFNTSANLSRELVNFLADHLDVEL